jgi:hypothetical protein
MNKVQRPTRGHKTLGAKWLFELQFSHQSQLYLDSEVASKSPTFHTAKRWHQLNKLQIKYYSYV